MLQVKEKRFQSCHGLKSRSTSEKRTKIDVVLTRSDDTFLALAERVKVAQKINADIFISIHANSGPAAATG